MRDFRAPRARKKNCAITPQVQILRFLIYFELSQCFTDFKKRLNVPYIKIPYLLIIGHTVWKYKISCGSYRVFDLSRNLHDMY